MSSVHLLTPSLDSEDALVSSDLGALTSAAALLELRQRTDNNAQHSGLNVSSMCLVEWRMGEPPA